MTKKWIKLAQVVLSLVSLLVISLHPAVSSAADDADVQAKLKSLVEANVLKPIPFKGNCTSIQFKVQVGSVFKLVDLPDTPLKVVVPRVGEREESGSGSTGCKRRQRNSFCEI